uniref:Uncharacterized protein n=1 Tax=viral metagenome TaxID=1070528 RepID=A0A6C0DBM6_9ZZZZ
MALYVNPENQKLLWNIINKHPKIIEYFSNRPSENQSYWFQSCIGYIYENIKYENLTIDKLQHCNKETLKYMLSTIKEPSIDNDLRNDIQYSRTNVEQNLSKSDLLNKNFAIRQKEYEDMNEKKVPDSIDFRDKIDDEPISNMDEVLRTHLQMRENELKQYAPLPVVPENKNNIVLDIEDSKMKKSVSWEDSEIEILKKQIRDLFKKMDKMQEEIDVLNYKKNIEQEEIKENQYKNINHNTTNGSI